MLTYEVVHGPTPGISRSTPIASDASLPASRRSSPSALSRASERSASARVRGNGSAAGSSSASASGAGSGA